MGVSDLYLAYSTAAVMGLIHGSDPGHGWPLSAVHGSRTTVSRAVALTSILAVGHFISTLAVVAAVWLLGSAAPGYLEYLRLAAGAALIAIGLLGLYKAARSHEEHHHHIHAETPWEMFKYALLLGFAHEEEVALAAIILLGAHPLLLALTYSLAVYASMVAWTLASIYVIRRSSRIEEALHSRIHLLSPLILVAVGVYVLVAP